MRTYQETLEGKTVRPHLVYEVGQINWELLRIPSIGNVIEYTFPDILKFYRTL